MHLVNQTNHNDCCCLTVLIAIIYVYVKLVVFSNPTNISYWTVFFKFNSFFKMTWMFPSACNLVFIKAKYHKKYYCGVDLQ